MRMHAMVGLPVIVFLATLLFTAGVALTTNHVHLHPMILQSMRIHAMAKMPARVSLATL
jgi:hypothetical protein